MAMHEMRRKDRAVTDADKIRQVILSCSCCRLGFYDEQEQEPYILPLNFGYEEAEGVHSFYFHSANAGRKIALLSDAEAAGKKLAIEMDTGAELIEGTMACQYSMRYQSVMGTGYLSVLKTPEEKRHGLNCLMAHYSQQRNWTYPDAMLNQICVFCLKVKAEALSCKEHL